MDPRDGDADTARKNAQRALTSLSALKGPFDRAASRSQELSRQIFEQATPVGWLGTDQHGRWECLAAAGGKLKPEATLWMAVPPTSPSQAGSKWETTRPAAC